MNAKSYGAYAAEIGRIAFEINPPDDDVYAQARKLIVFHLRVAAAEARRIAEAKAIQEGLPTQ